MLKTCARNAEPEPDWMGRHSHRHAVALPKKTVFLRLAQGANRAVILTQIESAGNEV
jgi:hypothetical protein